MRTHATGHGHLTPSGHALTISGWLTGIYFIVELAIGLHTGSIAVISDAFHTFSAVGGVLLAIVAARLAQRPADPSKTFGWYRAEVVSGRSFGAGRRPPAPDDRRSQARGDEHREATGAIERGPLTVA